MKFPRVLYLLVPLLVAIAIACGGSDSNDAAGATSDGSSSGSSSASVANKDGTIDLSKSADTIAELKSFRFDFSMKIDAAGATKAGSTAADAAALKEFFDAFTNMKAEGTFVGPDRTEVKTTFAGEQFSFVQIGAQSWSKAGPVAGRSSRRFRIRRDLMRF